MIYLVIASLDLFDCFGRHFCHVQNLVLVFAQVNMKECGVLMTKMSCFRSTLLLLNPKALRITLKFFNYNSRL